MSYRLFTNGILLRAVTFGVLGGAICLGGCVRSSYNVATQREELTLTSTDKEVEMGRKLAKQVEKELELVEDQAVQERAQSLGQRLAAVCDRQELVYTFAVVKDEEVNAFSLPGGYVFLNEGLVERAASDDELAAVLAHEIAHIVARHAVKRYETSWGAQLLQLATLAAARNTSTAGGVGVAIQATRLAYARQDELEADRLAVRYLQEAGFDPTAMLTFLERLRDVHEEKDLRYMPRGIVRPHYAMTHPFIPERIRTVKEELYGVADYIDYLNTPD